MEKKSKELEIAILAAKEAGKVLEKYFETGILREFKEDKSVVTLADKESEEVIKKVIFEAFPDHSIFGEETGLTENGGSYKWHIDPLDGTKNFANAIPIFAVSIALEHKGRLKVGVVYNPPTKNIFYAEAGKGTYCNDKRIYVSKDDKEKSVVSCSTGEGDDIRILRNELYYNFARPRGFVRTLRDLGSSAMELAYVARGGLEANVQLGLKTYDFAAGVLLVEEAGGKITNLEGDEWKFPENYFIASNGIFHDLLVKEIKNQKQKLNIKL